MLILPVKAMPNQTFSTLLAGQACQVNLTTRNAQLYMDLYVDNFPVILSVICQDRNRIVRSVYLGFIGDFWFADTQGTDDPFFTGLGSRFLLEYIEASELPSGIG